MKLFILNVIAWLILVGFFYQQQAQGNIEVELPDSGYLLVPYPYLYDDLIPHFRLDDDSYVKTDSVIWNTVEVDSLHLGKPDCDHDWVYSKEWRAGGSSYCCVNHNGSHCNYDDGMRNRICRICYRKETQREIWYEHRVNPPLTPYEILEDRLNDEIKSQPEGMLFDLSDSLTMITYGKLELNSLDFNNWTIQDYTIGVGDFEITSFYFHNIGLRISWENGIVDVKYPDSMNATEVAKEFFEALSEYMIDGYFLSKSEWQKFTCETNENFTEGETIFRKK